jgi:hypothetical protein
MSTVTPIAAPPYTSEQYVEHRDILPVVLIDTETGKSTSASLNELSATLVANTVLSVALPATVSYLRLQNTNASGHIYFRFNIAPTVGDYKSITLDPGEIFNISSKFKATNIQILRASNGNFNLIAV